MIKKISRYTLQQIFIESLEECDSFRIIDGLNPFHIMLNGKELYIYIKNLSPAYFTNPDVWRVQLPKKEEFDPYKDIPESVHRKGLEFTFDNGSIKGYDEFEEALKSAYANAGVKLGHNRLVKLITFLKNKRMVVMENNTYHFMPDFHY